MVKHSEYRKCESCNGYGVYPSGNQECGRCDGAGLMFPKFIGMEMWKEITARMEDNLDNSFLCETLFPENEETTYEPNEKK